MMRAQMPFVGGHTYRWLTSMLVVLGIFASGWTDAQESEFSGLIRTKLPDRGSYRAPQFRGGVGAAQATNPTSNVSVREDDAEDQVESGDRSRDSQQFDAPASMNPIGRVAATESPSLVRPRVQTTRYAQPSRHTSANSASHSRASTAVQQTSFLGEPSCGWEPGCGLEPGCGMEPACGCELSGRACDGLCGCSQGACDGYGDRSCGNCGSMGCTSCRTRLCLDPCQWFGSLELLMMWRVGDGLPALVTTSTAANGTGVLGATGTQVLFGNNRVLDDLTAGGRLTVGTWLDDAHCHSLVLRGWSATQADYSFRTDQTENPILARPFFNVTNGVAAANGSQVIASPNLREGSIQIQGSNEVFGGDVSLRQPWVSGLGGHIDFLYGYQYMRMNDSLQIATNSLELPPAQPTVLDLVDSFNAKNEFHGGQLGLAARYYEGCWSFNGTIKAAAGSLRRTAIRRGTQTRTLGANRVTEANGLLVRSTNRGQIDDNTFGWVPELDATLGFRWTPSLNLTFGYHAIAMPDALQASGMIDPGLAVNAADIPVGANTPPGQQRPSNSLRFDTFYVHGIHFGVNYMY